MITNKSASRGWNGSWKPGEGGGGGRMRNRGWNGLEPALKLSETGFVESVGQLELKGEGEGGGGEGGGGGGGGGWRRVTPTH